MEKGSCSGTPSSTSRSSGRSRRGTATRWARSTTRRSSGIGRRKPEDDEAGRVWAAHAAEEIANWEVFLPTLYRLWRVPTVALMLWGYALTLLAFLFFGRYFQGNYLGYILAVATPVPFLLRESRAAVRVRRRREVRRPAAQPAPARSVVEQPLPEGAPASLE